MTTKKTRAMIQRIILRHRFSRIAVTLLIALACQGCVRHSYIVKTMHYTTSEGAKAIEIVVPPLTDIPLTGSGHYIPGTDKKYQALFVQGLSGDYDNFCSQLALAEHKHYSSSPAHTLENVYGGKYFRLAEFTGSFGQVTIGVNRRTVSPARAAAAEAGISGKFSDERVEWFEEESKSLINEKKTYAIRIELNYDFLQGKKDEMIGQFGRIHTDLVRLFAYFERETKFSWPSPIAQDIVEKFFEAIPVPVDASLVKYGFFQNASDAVVLLNQQFSLRVDDTERIGVVSSDFSIGWRGENHFRLERRNGKLIQNKFAYFPDASHPDNAISDNLFYISSFADVQNSGMRDKPYVVLFEPVLKRNNKPKSQPDPYFAEDDKALKTGNSLLIHLTAAELIAFDPENPEPKKYGCSVFGERNSSEPMIIVWVNGQPRTESFNTRLSELRDLPEHIILYRKFKKDYAEVKGDLKNLILLNNDQIKFDL